jgi:acetyl-CoA carboxylase carboxyl transferase subunit beta
MAASSKTKWNGFSLRPKREMPSGLWMRCDRCEHMLYRSAVEKNLHVCPDCNYHFRIGADQRIEYLVDEGSFEPILADLTSGDPLGFRFRGITYKQRLKADRAKSGQKEALVIGNAFIKGRGVVLGVMEPGFLMGSMGSVVGEKLCAAVDVAMDTRRPLVVVCSSGGARMHEGVVSLGQMAKTSAALARFDEAGGLFISLLTDPTTGGVTASFAMLGDVILAEPGAMIGFAGRRTIAETIKVELPEGFQTAEFMLEHGFIDMIVTRSEQRSEVARLIDYCQRSRV